MTIQSDLTPRSDFASYLHRYTHEMGFTDEEPAAVLDRYHTTDIEWYNDGIRLDRERLIAHARPARRNATSARLDVHDVLVCGDRVAARYTMAAAIRGQAVTTEIYLFGRFAPDGRLRRVDQLTRTLPGP